MASAYQRAAHLAHDPPPWILEDRLARSIIGDEFYTVVDAAMCGWPSEVFAAFRAHFVVRARLAEDVAVERLRERRRDYVLLGAGADTFAWRHPQASAFTVWEIDHPASQAWKRAALERAGLVVPQNVRFLPVDLATVPLAEVPIPPSATWNWLGVTQYLEKSATESVLAEIAAHGPGTTAVVEFLLDETECDDLGVAFLAHAIAGTQASGEPMVSFYRKAEVEPLIRGCGFGSVELLDAPALNQRYVADDSGLCVPGAAIFAIATVQ
jgi:methyltransferase (TIGR00027 family)